MVEGAQLKLDTLRMHVKCTSEVYKLERFL